MQVEKCPPMQTNSVEGAAMKSIRVEDAVGMVLAHDLTKIVPGEFKGAPFKKGYVIRQEDIEVLKDMGKYHVFVVTMDLEDIHEEEGAKRIAEAACSGNLLLAPPSEGKVNIRAKERGLLRIDRKALEKINELGKLVLVTLHDNTLVEKDRIVAASKIIPLTIEKELVEKAEQICRENPHIIDVKPIHPLKAGIVVTGSEVYYGRIKDKFGEVLTAKLLQYGGQPMDVRYAPDDADFIQGIIRDFIQEGVDMVLISGGMAVDADDVTPRAISGMATEIVSYGAPLLPGAMCMAAYHDRIPLMGIPACAMFSKTTVLDVLLPRLLAGERLQKSDFSAFAHGGLCLHCEECRYPVCPFGK